MTTGSETSAPSRGTGGPSALASLGILSTLPLATMLATAAAPIAVPFVAAAAMTATVASGVHVARHLRRPSLSQRSVAPRRSLHHHADAILASLEEGVVVIDAQHRIIDANPAGARILAEATGAGAGLDHLHASGSGWTMVDDGGNALHDDDRPGGAALRTGTPEEDRTIGIRTDDGSTTWLSTCARPVTQDERTAQAATSAIVWLRDVTHQRVAQAQLRELDLRDALTGLPNRRVLIDRLEHALARAARQDTHVGVLFVDLDRFKSINESVGHDLGDHLLQQVGERLQRVLRPSDTAARLSGDEFVVVCEDLHDIDDARKVAERVAHALEAPYLLPGESVTLTTSVGVALGGPESSSEELLRNADRAMFQAKESGRSQYQIFNDAIARRALERLALERDLRRALDGDQFLLHYQPIIDLRTGEVSGVEALLRWEHPDHGTVSPTNFIDIAEESGAIIPIGRWALLHACTELAAGIGFHDDASISLSVNVSARQAARADFGDRVAEALDASGLEPHRLSLELTESVFLEASGTTITGLERLKDLGVRLAIDDFGTGYSSLTYLRRLPVDAVKVDRSFVRGLTLAPEDDAIVEAVVNLAQTFRLDVVAEGVESVGQVESLRRLGCQYGQGYLLGRPAPAGAPDTAAVQLPAAAGTH